MGNKSNKKMKKKVLWRELLKKKWDQVKNPKKQSVSQCKWIA